MNRETQNTASAGALGPVPHPFAQRIEALLRSLHGVQDARVELGKDLKPRAVYVTPQSSTAAKGLTRNVQSGLQAALRIALDPKFIYIVPELPARGATPDIMGDSPEAPVLVPVADTPAPARARSERGDGARRLVGVGRTGPAAGYKPPPRIEVLELKRTAGGEQLQCRVVVEVAGRRRTGVAEAGEEREGAVQLAARATLDALRFIEPGEWIFEGAADVIIAGQRHIVVSVARSEDLPSLSGAAPVNDSVEHAVAVAVLNAAGLSGGSNNNDNLARAAQR